MIKKISVQDIMTSKKVNEIEEVVLETFSFILTF